MFGVDKKQIKQIIISFVAGAWLAAYLVSEYSTDYSVSDVMWKQSWKFCLEKGNRAVYRIVRSAEGTINVACTQEKLNILPAVPVKGASSGRGSALPVKP